MKRVTDMKKEDLRITKTKQAIKDSFIELVEVKGYNRVSVTDIVKRLILTEILFIFIMKIKMI